MLLSVCCARPVTLNDQAGLWICGECGRPCAAREDNRKEYKARHRRKPQRCQHCSVDIYQHPDDPALYLDREGLRICTASTVRPGERQTVIYHTPLPEVT